MEELGSGSLRDIEGWGWLGGRLQGDRGRGEQADVFKEGRLVELVF